MKTLKAKLIEVVDAAVDVTLVMVFSCLVLFALLCGLSALSGIAIEVYSTLGGL